MSWIFYLLTILVLSFSILVVFDSTTVFATVFWVVVSSLTLGSSILLGVCTSWVVTGAFFTELPSIIFPVLVHPCESNLPKFFPTNAPTFVIPLISPLLFEFLSIIVAPVVLSFATKPPVNWFWVPFDIIIPVLVLFVTVST